MPVCSKAIRSLGCSTTSTRARSRLRSAQIEQRSESPRLKHDLQWRTDRLTSVMASARRRASGSADLSTWKARRSALRRPMPGRAASSSINARTGSG